MAGKTNFVQPGKLDYTFAPGEAQAFCAGLAYRAAGTQLSNPITDNPHPGDPEAGLNFAWDEGWTFADNQAGPGPFFGLNCPVPQAIAL